MSLSFAYLADRTEAVPQVARWWFDQWGHHSPGDSIEALTSRLGERLNRDQLPIQVAAILEDRVVGVAVLKLHEMSDLFPDRDNWLGNVYVAEEHRGQGIGSALAMKVVEIAKARGIRALHLQTENLTGGLYARLGWEKLEQTHYAGYDALVMVKQFE